MSALHRFEDERVQRETLERQREATAADPVAEQKARAEAYEKLVGERQKRLQNARGYLKMLRMPAFEFASFNQCFPDSMLVAPARATDDDIGFVEEELTELRETEERLQTRCESDGLLITLRHLMDETGWSCYAIAQQFAQEPTKYGADPDGGFFLDQLQGWLGKNKVECKPSGLAFLLHHAGTSLKELMMGKCVKADRFAAAFDKVPYQAVSF